MVGAIARDQPMLPVGEVEQLVLLRLAMPPV